ncbi:MAG: hypothetical protein JXR14_00710 [Paracoccaceae bacterium]
MAALALLTAGCSIIGEGNRGDTTRDYGDGVFSERAKDLSTLKAGIWVDPRGCDHWIIDDGIEGYLSARLDRDGKPVCSGAAPNGYAVGDFKSADLADSI